MVLKAVFPSQYIQGVRVLDELQSLIDKFGSKALLLASPSVLHGVLPKYEHLNLDSRLTKRKFGGECSMKEINGICSTILAEGIDIVIGMGGGKTIDAAKIAADLSNIPIIIVPTIASTDAPCSGCAVTYTEQGVFESVLYQKRNPAVVLVDLNIIANSPTRFLVSGMGDALATWFEANSCHTSQSLNECGGHATLAGMGIAKLCYDTLLEYGYQAKIANDEHIVTPALSKITEANILLSGIGFESCGIASAHAIHNGLTSLSETHRFYHGEKVAIGVLTGLHLNSATSNQIDEVYTFCEQIGLPTTLADVGIENVERDSLRIVAHESCSKESSMHHESGKITEDMVLDALLMADAFGKKRKQEKFV